MTPVIFRKFSDGAVIALFPTLPGTYDVSTCLSYMTIGQHGTASINLINSTRPAKFSEYFSLYKELISVGYNDLKVCVRYKHSFVNNRLALIRKVA